MSVGKDSAVQPHNMGGVRGVEEGHTHTHRNTHTGTYTQMLHLPFSDLPLKKRPTYPLKSARKSQGDATACFCGTMSGREVTG